MKKYTTSERLKQVMEQRGMKQIDILECVLPICKKYKLKMNRSDISQYVSGKVEPNQRKLVALAEALNVSETWLMGYEINKDREELTEESALLDVKITKDERLKKIAKIYFELEEEKKEELHRFAMFLRK